MEWLTLLVWLMVVGLALPAAAIPVPSMALHAPFPLASLGCYIAFAAGAPVVFAWIAVGCGALTAVVASIGAHTLVEDSDTIGWIGAAHKEVSALLVGFELTLLAAALPLTVGVAIAG